MYALCFLIIRFWYKRYIIVVLVHAESINLQCTRGRPGKECVFIKKIHFIVQYSVESAYV